MDENVKDDVSDTKGVEVKSSASAELEIPMPKSFTRLNEKGYLETIDALTGETLSVFDTKPAASIDDADRFVEVAHPKVPGKFLLVDRKINIDNLGNYLSPNHSIPYSARTADLIFDAIINGAAITKLAEANPIFPSYSVVNRWRKEHPEFNDMVMEAYRMRAEKRSDEVIDIADEAPETMEGVAKAKLQVESRKWQASVDNARFGKDKEKAGPTAIQINIVSSIPNSDYASKVAGRQMSDTGIVVDVTPEGDDGQGS